MSKDSIKRELDADIKSAILGGVTPKTTGFYAIKCPMCRSKETKAGFKFEPDKIIYNCFKGKCTASTEYVYGEHVSKNFKELMETIGVQIPLNAKFSNKKAKVQSLDLSKYESKKGAEVKNLNPED